MKKEINKSDSIFKLPINNLLIQIFKEGKAKSFESGAVVSLYTSRSKVRVLAEVTKDRTLSSMYIDLGVISANLSGSVDTFTRKLFKEELNKLRGTEESVEIILNAFNSFEDLEDLFINDCVQDKELLEKLNQTIEILPAAEREGIVFDIHRSLQRGFNRALHEEMPKLMEDFYDNILEALEKESFENIKEIFEAEKLKWHSLSLGFP